MELLTLRSLLEADAPAKNTIVIVRINGLKKENNKKKERKAKEKSTRNCTKHMIQKGSSENLSVYYNVFNEKFTAVIPMKTRQN